MWHTTTTLTLELDTTLIDEVRRGEVVCWSGLSLLVPAGLPGRSEEGLLPGITLPPPGSPARQGRFFP